MADALVLQWSPAPKRLTLQWLSPVGELPAVRPDQPLPSVPVVIGVGPTSARGLSFDDTLTALGVDNVQDAIVALYALIGATPPAPAPVLLSGALGGSSALAGALSVTRALSGQVSGSGALTAALTVEREGLSGSVIAAGLLTGSLEVTKALVGAVEGASAVVGALEVTRPLSAALEASGVVAGSLTVERVLAGSIYGMGALTGALTVEGGLGTGDDFFAYDGSTYPFITATQPTGFYDPVGNRTYVAYEGWNGLDRVEQVQFFDHAANQWSPRVTAAVSALHNDDHGTPAISMDHQGYIHVFYGPHSGPMRHVVSTNPRDITAWTARPQIGQFLTYPHPVQVGSTLVFISRREQADASLKMPLDLYRSTALSGGVETFAAPVTLVDHGNDSRVYIGSTIERGGKVYIAATRAPFSDNFRKDVFIYVYDPATGSVSNLGGTVTVSPGSFPIMLATSEASFRVFNHAEPNTGGIPSLCFDTAGNLHLVLKDGVNAGKTGPSSFGPYNAVHMVWNGTAWSAPFTFGQTDQRYDSEAVTPLGDGIEVFFTKDTTPDTQRGGDVYRRTRNAAGVWSAEQMVRAKEGIYALDALMPVLNATPDLRWVFGEKSTDTSYDGVDQSSDLKAGYQRVFAWGAKGYAKRPWSPFINLSTTTATTGAAVGSVVAFISSDNPRATYALTANPGGRYSIVGNELRVASALAAGTDEITIQSTIRGRTFSQSFSLTVSVPASVEDSAIAVYRLNAGNGATTQIVADHSPNANHAVRGSTDAVEPLNSTNPADPAWIATGMAWSTGNGLVCTGPYTPAMNSPDIHILAAVRVTHVGGVRGILTRDNVPDGQRVFQFAINTSRGLRFTRSSTSGNTVFDSATEAVNLNAWHLVEVRITGTAVLFRVDGVDRGTATLASPIDTTRTAPLCIGNARGGGGYNSGFQGDIGDVSFYAKALTDAEATEARSLIKARMSAKGVTLP